MAVSTRGARRTGPSRIDAKAAHPDLSWWQFLHIELLALAFLLVWLPIYALMSPEQLNSLLTKLMEFAQLIRMAKGEL